MTRTRWTVRLAGMVAGLALSAGPAAGQGIPVTVGVGAIQTGAGAFDLPVVLDMSARSELLGSFAVTVRWNPAVLQMQGGVAGSFGNITVNEDSLAAGVVWMAGVNPAGVGGLITLGVGRFTVLTNDTTTFRVTVQELYASGTFADLTASAVPLDRLFCGSLAGRWGDVNRDAAVNGADALIVLTESVGLDVSQFAMGFGDVDSSGVRDPRDALIILSYAVGISTPTFRVGMSVGGAICTPPGAQSYGINPMTAEALVGQEMNYFAYGLDSTGAALALRNVTWMSSNTGVASVDVSGVASAVAAGTATITARQNDTTIATGTLTVLATRRTHWVDALALNARNQVGSTADPFGVLQDAVSAAATGDTVRIRSGRLAGATVDRSLTLVGDTSAGGTRPMLIPADLSVTSPTVLMLTTGAGHVTIRDVQVDTAALGIAAVGVDTVDLYHVDVRAAGNAFAAVHVDSGMLVRLNRVRLFGRPNAYASTHGLWTALVGTVVVDSSLASDFSYDGIFTDLVDSVDIRNSTLRYNANSGLRIVTVDTARAARLVFSRNRVIRNQYYGVSAYYVRQASFDHNSFVGEGYYGDGIQLGGTRAGILTLLGDTLNVRGSDWISASTMDSVLVDSLTAVTSDYGGYVYDARVVVIRNSDFASGYYEAFYVSGRGADSTTLVVRNSRFSGLTNSGYYDGYGLQTYNARADVRDSEFSDLYYGIEAAYGAVDVSHSTFDRAYYAIYNWCAEGDSRVDSTSIKMAYYGVYAYGCGTGMGTLTVDSVEVLGGQYGVEADNLRRVRVRHSRFQDLQYAIETSGNDTVSVDTTAMAPWYNGAYTYADTLATYTGNTVTCADNNDTYALEANEGNRAVFRGNTITGPCWTGIYTSTRDTVEIRGNTISGSGYRGVYGYANDSTGQMHIVGNTVSGPFQYGSIHTDAAPGRPLLIRVDSNTVSSGLEAGILNLRGDTVLVRDNVVTGVRAGCCSVATDGGIVVTGNAVSRKRLEILRNRITGSARGIVVDRAAGDTVRAVVDTNRIVGSDSVGIFVGSYTWILARHNAVDLTGLDGMRVDRIIAGDDTTVTLTNNNFTNSGQYGVNNLDGGSIDARNNWWGDAAGPGNLETSGDFVSSGVLYDPWLAAPAVTLPPAPPSATMAAFLSAAPRRTTSEPTVPALREPRTAATPPSAGPSGWEGRAAERQQRQEARIRQYQLQVEREAARAAERAARREEDRR